MTRRIATLLAALAALALAGPVAAQDKRLPEDGKLDRPAPKPGGKGVIWQENEEI